MYLQSIKYDQNQQLYTFLPVASPINNEKNNKIFSKHYVNIYVS